MVTARPHTESTSSDGVGAVVANKHIWASTSTALPAAPILERL